MTTFELTWQQHNNVVPADQTTVVLQMKSFLWWVKSFVTGNSANTGSGTIGGSGLWTPDYSCDGVTAGTPGDGVDRWGAAGAFDATKLIRSSGAVAHSWMVLKSPIGLGPFYMLLDWSASVDYQMIITFSKNAFTGGTTTAAPTATNSWTYPAQQMIQASLAGAHWFGLLSTTGVFHIKAGRDSGGFFQTALSFFSLANSKTGEAHNGFSYVDFSTISGVNAVWRRARLSQNNALIKGRNKDGTAAVVLASIVPGHTDAGGSFVPTFSVVGNTDATDGLFDDYPQGLVSVTPGHLSIRGRIADIYCAPESSPQGNIEPTSGPPYQSVICGDTWQPYNGSVAASL